MRVLDELLRLLMLIWGLWLASNVKSNTGHEWIIYSLSILFVFGAYVWKSSGVKE